MSKMVKKQPTHVAKIANLHSDEKTKLIKIIEELMMLKLKHEVVVSEKNRLVDELLVERQQSSHNEAIYFNHKQELEVECDALKSQKLTADYSIARFLGLLKLYQASSTQLRN